MKYLTIIQHSAKLKTLLFLISCCLYDQHTSGLLTALGTANVTPLTDLIRLGRWAIHFLHLIKNVTYKK